MTPGEPSIQDCIETLYRVFKPYRFTDMDGDLAFPGSCDPEPLQVAPLRELPAKAFETFAWKSMTTWGAADDFRHFLPRMLELIYTHTDRLPPEVQMLEPEFLFGKLHYGKWLTWPSKEIHAIESFLEAWWGELIYSEDMLSQLKKTPADSLYWFAGDWVGAYCRLYFFLSDLDYLYHDTLGEKFKRQWAETIISSNRIGPILNLAAAYVDENDCGLLDRWYKETERCEALYAAWLQYQDDSLLGAFFSDAHAKAELACVA